MRPYIVRSSRDQPDQPDYLDAPRFRTQRLSDGKPFVSDAPLVGSAHHGIGPLVTTLAPDHHDRLLVRPLIAGMLLADVTQLLHQRWLCDTEPFLRLREQCEDRFVVAISTNAQRTLRCKSSFAKLLSYGPAFRRPLMMLQHDVPWMLDLASAYHGVGALEAAKIFTKHAMVQMDAEGMAT